MSDLSPAPRAGLRIALVDLARGLALVAMAIYHGAWDLQFLRLAPVDAVGHPGWKAFAHLIAGSFLALVGVSLVLATRDGLDWRSFAKRLALVGGAALAVTAATLVATPDTFIYFGILHCIALSSVLALPFLRAPILLVLATAAAVAILPHVFQSAVFDAAALRWTGLATSPPATSDFVPIFPWFGAVLAGVAAARIALQVRDAAWWSRWRSRGAVSGSLVWAGRHSLPIYLVHQPILLGVLWTMFQVTGPNAAAETAVFMGSCVPACTQGGGAPASCRTACVCSADAFRRDALWRAVMDNRLDADQRRSVSAVARECPARAR